ncbi:hypothetical protein A3B32_00730 [Candidatus Uhrbacteria bacterium RIFCSPLOWO2_01_FULL_53_9]|uniref:Uncharacterized protein n=2 Tax=Candidatus Uhriibacteriota TaxID=1752732 RepID=A0A1F7UXG8_9BACT|nr:MAG: hypothetical protein A3B32_00730 [Candidatus Uhrbacteria bacterium RIFCSPLOWO2_01_FULL_53_9]OGL89668.1 MAG: hypothetical protein A3I45_01800 [Candidatus Uhrbacteria bacterium RIFCSPLOWO2_02_FULL_53_10]
MKRVVIALGLALLLPRAALAHCPLCTVGAGAAAIGAAWLGVDQGPIGIFIGAFAIAVGSWIARIVPWKIPGKAWLFAVVSFITTVLPLLAIMQDVSSIYVAIGGVYGSPFNAVYLYNVFLVGSVVGAVVMAASPSLNRAMQKHQTRTWPFQGMALTFTLLLVAATLMQILL